MSNSLDHFIRDAFEEHDGRDSTEMPTIVVAGSKVARGLGTLPGHVVEEFIARGAWVQFTGRNKPFSIVTWR